MKNERDMNMEKNCLLTERRQHQRHRVQKNAFAIVGNESMHPGQITEISLSGMVFQYNSTNGSFPEATKVDILSANYTEALLIRNLNIKTISDLVISEEDANGSAQLRKQAISFGDLTRRQKSRLKYFIQFYSSERI
jgi:hypothetical protein